MKLCVVGGGDKTPMIRAALDQATSGNVLVVPTACSTQASYDKKVAGITQFFQGVGLTPTILHEYGQRPTPTQLAHELGRAGLAYTLGGNSPYMLRELRAAGTDEALAAAARGHELTLAGVSAGALLPFALGHSCVAPKPAETPWDYEFLPMLGLVNAVATAHANQHDPTPNGLRPDTRREALAANFPAAVSFGFAIDNGAGIVVNGDESRVVVSNTEARVHLLERSSDIILQTPVDDDAHLSAVMQQLTRA